MILLSSNHRVLLFLLLLWLLALDRREIIQFMGLKKRFLFLSSNYSSWKLSSAFFTNPTDEKAQVHSFLMKLIKFQ